MKNLNYKSTNMLSIMEMLEKDIETECYICTEPTEEKSPCVCGAHVHMKCLVEWIEKNDNKRYTCSICHSDLEGIRPAKTKSSIVYKSTYRPGLIDGGHMCALILKMFYWLVMGFIGKYFFAMLNNPSWIYLPEYWSPFDLLFFACACFTTMVSVTIIATTMKLWNYLRSANDNNYEEFDNDSDDDYAV